MEEELNKHRLLEDVRYIGSQRRKYSNKDEFMFGGMMKANRAFRKEPSRDMTQEETLQTGKNLERAYNRELRQKRKDTLIRKVAAF
jgi:hypothetical protein